MTRERLTIYLDGETKRQLASEADDRDMTNSERGAHLLDRGRMAEAEESLTSRTDVEAALERTIESTVAEYHDALLDAVRKASVYSIADYELTASTAGASGATPQDTFATGRRRTHTPLSDHEETMADDSTTETDQGTDESDPQNHEQERERGSLVDDLR